MKNKGYSEVKNMISEQKIKYEECDEVRILRGRVTKEAEDHIIVERRDGIYKIYKRVLIYIEQPNYINSNDYAVVE